MNALKKLESYGQSVWLDYLSRKFILSGELEMMMSEDGLTGMTSNPSIFEKAIDQSNEYDSQILELLRAGTGEPRAVFRALAVRDIQKAADLLAPVYQASNGGDGFVSFEVSPNLAGNTEGTIKEAREMWALIARPNLMIKVPATAAGLPAIRRLISEGINVNITLLFSCEVYRQVAEAYISGLENRDYEIDRIASVASFFVSRIDTKVDKLLEERMAGAPAGEREKLESLRGKIAIANAKLAYSYYKEIFSGERWEALKARGARPQRLLWASTSTKNKAYSDVLYVDSLIGPDTVNTIPRETLEAYSDHGAPAPTLEKDLDGAKASLAALKTAGISLDRVTDELTVEGVQLFMRSADKLYAALKSKIGTFSGEPQKHASAGS